MSKINISTERVNAVINAVNSESTTLGAVVRNFVAVCENDDYARYMLDAITGTPCAHISMTVNAIKVAVIAKYPYKDGGTLLRKDGDLFVPFEKYSADIIRRSFYVAVGHKKAAAVVAASAEDIQAHNAKKDAKKAENTAKREAAKAKADNYEKFYNEIMNAAESDIITIVRKYKALAAGTDVAAANIILG